MNSFGKLNKTETEFQSIINEKNHKLYERFLPEKFANSGNDTTRKIIEFNNKDIIKPLKKPNIYSQEINKKILQSNSWAINTSKNCTSENKLPKLQNFKNYNFIKINEEEAEKYKKQFFETDHITTKCPKENKTKYSFIDVKKKFSSNTETYDESWGPKGDYKSVNNRSSVTYNILNNDNEYSCGMLDSKLLDVKLSNRKKCIGEYNDLYHIFYPNFRKKYDKHFKENENIFKNYKGRFTHISEIALMNENMLNLFKNTGSNKSEDKKKHGKKNEFAWGKNTIRIQNSKDFSKTKFDKKFNKTSNNSLFSSSDI